MVHIDTSFLVRALVPGSDADARLRLWLSEGEPLAMSTIAWAELLCGPLAPAHLELVERLVPRRCPFLEEDAVLAARLFNETGRRRGTLADCMIATVAIREQAVLATKNPADFSRFRGAGLRMSEGRTAT